MSLPKTIFLGIDCGATTSKFGCVNANGECFNTTLWQRPTGGDKGPEGIVSSWMEGAAAFLADLSLSWSNVAGVGLAIPGPYLEYGVLGPMPNLPANLTGWRFLEDLTRAVATISGREIPVLTANDGQLAGLAEARIIQRETAGSVLMLAPGTGLGCSFVNADGSILSGDHQAAAILCHIPAPYDLLGLPKFLCGCGRRWGCFEAYTSLSGLPQLISHLLPKYPNHKFQRNETNRITQALSLRNRAQQGDLLALEIFDLQAKAMGHAVAVACMAYDPSHVVIGGGLMDPNATTENFRSRYLKSIQNSATEFLWIEEKKLTFRAASLGELSQAIGAALLARSKVSDNICIKNQR